MCGIAGFVGRGSGADLERMTRAVEHRGPDDEGMWQAAEAPVFLGHRRLSIIDIAAGHQPMFSADGSVVVVFNGEIYNHAELREELKRCGHSFVTDHSDTEVLLAGYREWGSELPTRLSGMWAFAIYDLRARTLFCSRDRFGKKPFFYSQQGGAFVFGSELSVVALHPSVGRTLSKRSLQKYFGYGYIPAPGTIYEKVYKLPGGHSLLLNVESLEFRVEKYWEFELDPFERIPANPEEEWGARLRELLENAVRRRLVADVPVGVFLSGGIDSSAITALAARHVPEGRLKTFSVGFEEASFDESEFARQVAAQFRTEHHEKILSMEAARTLLPGIIGKLDEPMGDSSLLPTYLLSQFTREKVTVALGGDGGDELFAGYDPWAALGKAELYRKCIPRPVHEGIRMLLARMPVSHQRMSLDFKIKRTLRGLSYAPEFWLPTWMGPLDATEVAAVFDEPIAPEDLYSEALECWESCPQTNLVDKALQFYTKLYLQDDILVKADRASMMHGLEVRSPFLDLDVVDFVRRIPAEWKYRNGERKYLLKKALEPLLPKEILYRSKQGFGVPIGRWLKEGDLEVATRDPSGKLSTEFLNARHERHRSGRTDERLFLWNQWVWTQWYQRHPQSSQDAATSERTRS